MHTGLWNMLGWTAPTASIVPGCDCAIQQGSRPMTIIRIGLDTAKHVFQVHGVDENEQAVVRRYHCRCHRRPAACREDCADRHHHRRLPSARRTMRGGSCPSG